MQEETYYSDGTNWVTNQRLIFGDAQFPLDDAVDVRRLAVFSSTVTWLRRGIIPAAVLLFVLSNFLEWHASERDGSAVRPARWCRRTAAGWHGW
jgi:hypothetical protein